MAVVDDRRGDQEAFERLRRGEEMKPLEEAARSRSEADWIVGMNATRAATIRLRASFDGAVSLGRVQTPTLAIVARREEEIRAFVPEPYWLVEATLRGVEASAATSGRYHAAASALRNEPRRPRRSSRPCRGQAGEITKLEKKEERERAPLLYDLTSLQRDANTRFGFSARRTLAAAQRLYEEHKALTYPRTNSRFLTGDMIPEIKPTAELRGPQPGVYAGRDVRGRRSTSLPLGRVVNDAKVTDHHAIIPTRSEHDLVEDGRRRAEGLRPGRAALPRGLPSRGGVREHARGDDGRRARLPHARPRLLIEAGWRGVYGERGPSEDARPTTTPAATSCCPSSSRARASRRATVESHAKETQPPRRFSDASLLGAMETAGKEVDDDELREAMKDSGIGTPATRAAIIERLIDVGYVERDGRALVATEKGLNVIRLLGEHPLTSRR